MNKSKARCEAMCPANTYAPSRQCSKRGAKAVRLASGTVLKLCKWHHAMATRSEMISARCATIRKED